MTIVSVAIPCYRSEKTISPVVHELQAVLSSREGFDYQIVLVNDYPGDNTFEVIRGLCAEDPRVIGVNLSKNFGQTAAKMAALPYVTGDVLVYMDDDGQHPAGEIWKLVDKVLEGYDMVYADFPQKKHSLFKRLTSDLNSKVLELNGSKPKDIRISSYHAMSRIAVDALREYKSPFPSMGGYLSHICLRYANVPVEHRARLAGQSNYTLGKMLKLWLTGFTNFSTVPLRFSAFVGMFCALIGFITGVAVILRKLITPSIAAGYTSIIAVLLFIGGIIMVILGLCGEYIGRIYMTVSNMPQYAVREAVNAASDREAPHEQ